MYIYYDNQGRVAMRSEEPLTEYGNLIRKKIPISETERVQLDGSVISVKNGKLEFEKMPRVKAREKIALKEELKVKAQQGVLDVKDLLNFLTLD
jgi:hypothetical protein